MGGCHDGFCQRPSKVPKGVRFDLGDSGLVDQVNTHSTYLEDIP